MVIWPLVWLGTLFLICSVLMWVGDHYFCKDARQKNSRDIPGGRLVAYLLLCFGYWVMPVVTFIGAFYCFVWAFTAEPYIS